MIVFSQGQPYFYRNGMLAHLLVVLYITHVVEVQNTHTKHTTSRSWQQYKWVKILYIKHIRPHNTYPTKEDEYKHIA